VRRHSVLSSVAHRSVWIHRRTGWPAVPVAGASMTLEYAVILAKSLRDAPDTDSAFDTYEQLRRDRVQANSTHSGAHPFPSRSFAVCAFEGGAAGGRARGRVGAARGHLGSRV